MVREGDWLGGAYKVKKIGADAVELEDVTTKAFRRLASVAAATGVPEASFTFSRRAGPSRGNPIPRSHPPQSAAAPASREPRAKLAMLHHDGQRRADVANDAGTVFVGPSRSACPTTVIDGNAVEPTESRRGRLEDHAFDPALAFRAAQLHRNHVAEIAGPRAAESMTSIPRSDAIARALTDVTVSAVCDTRPDARRCRSHFVRRHQRPVVTDAQLLGRSRQQCATSAPSSPRDPGTAATSARRPAAPTEVDTALRMMPSFK